MDNYGKLADVYDYLVQGVDYESWIDYVEDIAGRVGVEVKSVADLACGTGNTTLPFARRGYETVVGVDLAGEMLARAREKAQQEGLAVEFTRQDIRELQLPGKFDLVTCFHDGINYLLTPGDLKRAFTGIHKHLSPGGICIFDLNTLSWLQDGSSETTYVDEPGLTLIWDSLYDDAQKIWQINLLGFIKEGEYYSKFKEKHVEKAHSHGELHSVLEETGLELLHVYDAFTFSPPGNSVRLFYVARNTGKG